MNFTFCPPSLAKKIFDCLLDDKHKSNLSKSFFEKFGTDFHFVKVFFVILPLISIVEIFFFLRLQSIFGHISESIKNTLLGFQ